MITLQDDFFQLSPTEQLIMLQIYRVAKRKVATVSVRSLSSSAGVTYQRGRTAVAKLVEDGWIERSVKRSSVFTVCNRNGVIIKESAPPKTKEQMEDDLKRRQHDFYNSLIPFLARYSKEMIRAFYNYWSEPNKSCTKMRMELERTWQLDRRLVTWSSRTKEYGTDNNKQRYQEVEERRNDAASRMSRLLAEDDARS